MDGDLKWLLGMAAGMLGIWVSSFAGAVWQILRRIARVEENSKASDDALHERINKVREDTVHKSDLHDLGTRLDASIKEMRDQQQSSTNATNLRLDTLLAAIANRNETRGKDDR